MNKILEKEEQIKEEFKAEVHAVKQELDEERKLEREIQKEIGFRQSVKNLFSLHEDVASHDEIKDRIISGGKITGTNMCVLILAILIASVGLNTGSTAVIIGAMLISPLMGSILAMAYGTISADAKAFSIHLTGFVAQIIISLVASTLYFLLSPQKAVTSELLARTQPAFYDVIIAICGGLAGIIGQTRRDKSNNIIPGVAIATALMPPLCTCGYSIANGNFKMFLGAGYLFLVNTYFIFFASAIVLSLLKIPKVKNLSDLQWKVLKARMIRNAILISLPTILIGILMSFD